MDRIANNDQAKAHIAHSRSMLVSSCIQLALANESLQRGADRVDRSVDRLARSRVQLSDARRMLAGNGHFVSR